MHVLICSTHLTVGMHTNQPKIHVFVIVWQFFQYVIQFEYYLHE